MKLSYDSSEFAKKFHYDGNDLGATYTKEQTIFKVWAPVAGEVTLCLYKDGIEGDCMEEHPMVQKDYGIWDVSIKKDLEGIYYTYKITNGDTTCETQDIYGKACGVNGKRTMVVDLENTNPEGWQEDSFPNRGKITPAIYELHIKDFSSDPHSGVTKEHRGKYLAFTEEKTTLDNKGEVPTCLNYLKDLGITYVHLLPTFDFGSVDESKPLDDQFNWGYDPENYNIPEGGYATDAADGHVRIKEFKQMVQAIHKAGLGVVMDVVYNHTYSTDSAFQKTVPDYYYRLEEDGTFSNGSICGNDTASERYMYRKFMIESVCYWAKEYHIDGFRFDLMGLHDTETMNQIRKALDELPNGKEILMYGEPWSGGPSPMREGSIPALKKNITELHERIAIFNDDTRDAIKGSVFYEERPGYINGKTDLGEKIPSCVLAWCDGKGGYMPKNPGQIISYVSAHDNFTLWDKLNYTLYEKPDFYKEDKEVLKLNKMAAGIVKTCLGTPFFQAGEEFARTKNGIGDSYKTESAINQLDWNRACEYKDLTDYYKGLLAIRKHFQAFTSKESKIVNNFIFENTNPEEAIVFTVKGTGAEEDWWDELFIIYQNEEKDKNFKLAEGNWQLLCDGTSCIPKGIKSLEKEILAKGKAVTILGKIKK
ncbi:MAG: type I pullulanase [Lachnospiraceae bacterium]|nr:type I pullulanase [Lachnospiraceae bacterium]